MIKVKRKYDDILFELNKIMPYRIKNLYNNTMQT
jgi:hypothetical protein